ncbi:MAG: 2-amino-4-hydroxy-6-hydroxymethyldihydropteridine diphosphokinase [Cyclobacteriaceae bacterium]|nr:2-amino-4-hydroxy-6-hydroxymethyldihydropteridine diphosphokinase [Cyclobacteriaceae bacterium]
MNGIYLLLGSNIGDRQENLQQAILNLRTKGVKDIRHSLVYTSAPWGITDQDWFLNMVLEVTTVLKPEALLSACLAVEKNMGRERFRKWGPRTIDIDILYYGNQIINSDDLSLPHPGIPVRKFTLVPMNELAPKMKHPLLMRTQSQLLDECTDELECKIADITLNI